MNGMYGYPDMGGYYYDPYTMPDATGFAEGFAGAFLGAFILVIASAVLIWSAVEYVLRSIGLYTIAKRRGIYHPWLAWLPLGNVWILGSISDQYQYLVKGKVRSRRKILLALTIVVSVVAAPLRIMSLIGITTGAHLLYYLLYIVALPLAIILLVFSLMAIYDLFTSCDPDNAAMYLVLSILFGVTLPFFIFFSRKKDGGMPPRKVQQPVLEIPEQPAQTEETCE